ncbi:MAG: hypothetical protein GYA41_04590 [Bacteroidales bacterium]|jgi:uncharacterized protein YhbP (UPF0306 family)|nr:hypothetical protein [Bacteroidales bacterium]
MIDERISRFLRRHHVLTIATSAGNEPWCANCFYVYLPERNSLVFTTDHQTRHGKEFRQNNLVAGSVVLETKIPGRIRGIQFQAIVSEPEDEVLDEARKAYLKRFPVAMLMETHLWLCDLVYIKMTDNRLGFGKKLIWMKDAKLNAPGSADK